jgi:hypothetical protein
MEYFKLAVVINVLLWVLRAAYFTLTSCLVQFFILKMEAVFLSERSADSLDYIALYLRIQNSCYKSSCTFLQIVFFKCIIKNVIILLDIVS